MNKAEAQISCTVFIKLSSTGRNKFYKHETDCPMWELVSDRPKPKFTYEQTEYKWKTYISGYHINTSCQVVMLSVEPMCKFIKDSTSPLHIYQQCSLIANAQYN